MSDRLSKGRAGVSPGARNTAKPALPAAMAVGLSVAGACGLLVAPVAGGVDPLSGIDFVHITDPGNEPYDGFGNAFGCGGVSYTYHIGRMEVTTAQWAEFFNAAFDRPDPLPFLIPPDAGRWGAVPTTPNTLGGQRWAVPVGNELRPVGDISWRMAAIYCNGLHNGKSSDRAAFMNGAYDVSTFGFVANPGLQFTDQFAHHPDARYWIPTWDEWLKAAHYDPNKNGLGQGGWWTASNGSEVLPTLGPPGVGEANYGWDGSDFPGQNPFAVPLGAYAGVESPWGLFDTAGATSEWTESIIELSDGRRYRMHDGSPWFLGAGDPRGSLDWIRSRGGEFPHIPTLQFGLRIASAVPAPSAWMALIGLTPCVCRRNRRR